MQYFTRGMFTGACYSGLLFLGLGLSACSTSEDLDENTTNISPLAVDDTLTVDNGATARIDLVANDSDADDGLDLASIDIVSGPANGATVVNADGSVDYSHDGSNTTADTFTYTIRDNGAAVSNTATVTITIIAVNTAPTAVDDAFTVNKGSTTALNLATNDSDADDGLDFASISIVTAPVNGTVAVNANGTVDYTHNGGNSRTDSFSYTIEDNSGAVSNTAAVAITVSTQPVNIPPTAVNDTFTVDKGSTATLDLADNDNDTDDGLDLASIAIVALPAHGSVSVNADGTVKYTHNGDGTTADAFSYTISDNSAAVSNVANVSLTIRQPPLAVDDTFTVTRGETTRLDLAANDSDVDDGIDPASITIVAVPANGTVKVNADGTVDYSHDDSDMVTDAFSYTIRDNSTAVSNTANVTLTVLPVAPPPVAAGIYNATVVENADHLEFVVSLAEASTASISIDYQTADGTAVAGTDYVAANGAVVFAPGEVRKFIDVSVLNNPAAAAATSKQMQLLLSNPQNAVLSVDTATGTIVDKDVMSTDTAFTPGWGQLGAFTNAAKCGEACHRSDGSTMTYLGEDVSPGTQWQHSVMAQAFNDPYWQAAVEDEVESFPHLAGLIEDTCTRCHAPMGNTHAHQTGTSLDEGFYRFDTAKGQDHAREGVSCTLCHQIADANLGSEDSYSGQFIIPDSSDSTNYKRIYGPYENPEGNNMNMQTEHRPTYGAYVTDSALCATCHTLYTPAIDPDTGAPSGISFLEQGPYLEWQNSDYATGKTDEAQCQDCHMPAPDSGYSTKISLQGPARMQPRTPYGQHTLVGGNAHLLEIMSGYRSELGISASTTTAGFADQINKTRDFLGSAAQLTLSTPARIGDDLSFNVTLTNMAGHKLPSSYPSRRTWLHVTVRDSSGSVIFESGKPDSRGYISTDEARLKADCMALDKLDGFDSSLCYEPHRDIIIDASQVAIYETVLGDVNGRITHTLLRGAEYLKDNRIPPAGFKNSVAATIEQQTIPQGVNGDADFNCGAGTASEGCGADTVHYQVDTTGHTGPYSVEVKLLYQATQPAFVDGMHANGDRVNRFKVMYDAVPPSVEVLDTAVAP